MTYLLNQPVRNEWDTFCYYENALTNEECDKIIGIGLNIPATEATVDENKIKVKIRKTNVSWIKYNQETDFIFQKLAHFVLQANSARFKFNLAGFSEDLQFTRYTELGDFYDWHKDNGPGTPSIRKLSVVIQLTDPNSYEGSNLEFFTGHKYNRSVRARGTLIIFPSYEVHRVSPLISGVRYSLVSWVSGPPFA